MECARAISGPMLWDVFGPFFQQKRARHFSSKDRHAIFLAKTGTPFLPARTGTSNATSARGHSFWSWWDTVAGLSKVCNGQFEMDDAKPAQISSTTVEVSKWQPIFGT